MENRDRCVIVLRVLAKREYTSQKYQLTESNLAYLGGSLKSHAKFQSDVYKSRALSLLPPLYPSRFGASRLRYIADIGTRAPGNGPFPLSSSSPFSLLSPRRIRRLDQRMRIYSVSRNRALPSRGILNKLAKLNILKFIYRVLNI